MPSRNGIPFLTPYVAPVAAKARVAGPGEPSNKLVAINNETIDSNRMLP